MCSAAVVKTRVFAGCSVSQAHKTSLRSILFWGLIFANDHSYAIVIFLDFHSTKQGLPLVDSWSRGLD